jgi:hypothetical protein
MPCKLQLYTLDMRLSRSEITGIYAVKIVTKHARTWNYDKNGGDSELYKPSSKPFSIYSSRSSSNCFFLFGNSSTAKPSSLEGTYQTTRWHIAENINLRGRRQENLISLSSFSHKLWQPSLQESSRNMANTHAFVPSACLMFKVCLFQY